jgi:hypothetical protein
MKQKIHKLAHSKIAIGTACTAFVVSSIGFYAWYENQRPPILEIYVIPLKVGQAVFIRTPNDKRILIDGGQNSEIIKHISDILPFYSRRIDTLIVSKQEGKKVSGLIDVLSRYSVQKVILPGVDWGDAGIIGSADPVYDTFIEAISDKGKDAGENVGEDVKIEKVSDGDRLILDENPRESVVADILFPVAATTSATVKNLGVFKYSKASAPELVMKISYGSTSAMIIGSVTPKIQKFLVANSTATSSRSAHLQSGTLRSDVLVMSQNATTSNLAPKFLEVVSPHHIIYSKKMTANSQDDVHEELNIRKVGIVKIESDGKELRVSYAGK